MIVLRISLRNRCSARRWTNAMKKSKLLRHEQCASQHFMNRYLVARNDLRYLWCLHCRRNCFDEMREEEINLKKSINIDITAITFIYDETSMPVIKLSSALWTLGFSIPSINRHQTSQRKMITICRCFSRTFYALQNTANVINLPHDSCAAISFDFRSG